MALNENKTNIPNFTNKSLVTPKNRHFEHNKGILNNHQQNPQTHINPLT